MKRSIKSTFRVLTVMSVAFFAGATFTACTSSGESTDPSAAVEGESASGENAVASENGATSENLAGENVAGNAASGPEEAANGSDPFAGALNNGTQNAAVPNAAAPNAAANTGANQGAPAANELQTLVTESAGGAAANAPVADAGAAQQEADPFAPAAPVNNAPQGNVAATNVAEPKAESPKQTVASDATVPGALPEMGTSMPYYIQKGDTLSKISAKIYGDMKQWRTLAEENAIKNAALIYAGDVIFYKLNEKSKDFASNYEGSQKKVIAVESGDTLSGIALKVLGSAGEWRTLWKMNPSIQNPDVIRTGMVLSYRAVERVASVEANDDAAVAVNK